MKNKKCLFLIPTSFNDGNEVPERDMVDILAQLYEEFNGYSVDGVTEGTWRMEDGTKACDRSLKVWVVMTEDKVPLLKDLIKKFAKTLKQEAIYFEVMDWDGEFIKP